MSAEAQDLVGWKAIAAHLAVARSTAIAWAQGLGLPVSRLVGRVVARAAELDEWRRRRIGRPVRNRPKASD